MAYDPFHPDLLPTPEPVEGRTLPVRLVEEEEEPTPRPAWLRWAAAILAATLTAMALLSGLDLGIGPHPATVPVGR